MRLGWILTSVVLLALLAATAHGAGDDVADEFSVVNESDPIEWNNKGVNLYKQGEYEDALLCFDKALEIDPEFVYAWNGKGVALHRLGRYNEALICFNKALEFNKTYAYAWNGKGNALNRLGDYEEALICFDKALEIDSNFSSAFNGKGNALVGLGKYKDALICFDKVLEIDSNFLYALNGKGNALHGLGRYDDALTCFNKALEINSTYASAWNGKGNALNRLGKYKEALICFDKALEIDSNFSYALNGKGNALCGVGEYNEALICFNKSLEVDPKFKHALNGKGGALCDLGKYTEAVFYFDKALEVDSNYSYAWNGKGLALYKLGRNEEAIELYKKALQLDRKIPKFWYNKGNALESLHRSAEASMAYSLGREIELNSDTKGGIFAVFLVIYSALAVAGYVLSRRFRKYKMSIFLLAINSLGFVTVVWLLSGLFDFLLVSRFLVVGFLMFLISLELWWLSGFPWGPWITQLVLEIETFMKRYPRLSWWTKAVGLLAVLVYIPVAAVFYFRFYIGSEISMVHFLKFAFIWISFVSIFVTLPPIVTAMVSKNLDRGTRDILLIFQFGYFGITLLYLGLILWVIGNGSFGPSIPLGSIKFPISRQFLIIMMSLFLLVILTPYISGWKRASRWNVSLLEKERSWLDELLDVLVFQKPNLCIPKLREILDEIKDDDNIHGLDKEFNQIESLYGSAALRLDPRFCYRTFFMRHQGRIADTIEQLEELKGDREMITEAARLFAEAYRFRRDEIARMIEKEGQLKPILWVGLAFLLTPILASLIDWIMKAMIESNLGGLITSTPALPLP